MEITLKGQTGTFTQELMEGVANPINIMSKLIASMHDDNMKITIPGFYDKVIDLVIKTKMKF